jgi:glycosyltransferase involved in cell wall biosynthesis
MIKGYTGFVGKALVALKACELAADHLRDYEVVIYSASIKTRIRASKLRYVHKIRVTILKKRTAHSDMLQHFSNARIYIGISLSDGISTSLLEAMATGCYPIQTNTSCANEWIQSHSGSLVQVDDPESLSKELINLLTDDQKIEDAYVKNKLIISNKGSTLQIKVQANAFYQGI